MGPATSMNTTRFDLHKHPPAFLNADVAFFPTPVSTAMPLIKLLRFEWVFFLTMGSQFSSILLKISEKP